jgi:hypothetical protein
VGEFLNVAHLLVESMDGAMDPLDRRTNAGGNPNTRQHERGVNKRRQRIRTRKAGSQAKPPGFRPVPKPMIFQLENGRKSQKSKNVGHMRGLPRGDAVHRNEAGI